MPPISSLEAGYARAGDTASFESRLPKGDPLARTALNIVYDHGVLAGMANLILSSSLQINSPRSSTSEIAATMRSISVDIMRAHVDFVNQGSGTMSRREAASYHYPGA
jgi:hypothetical protein